jgi:hypothetical protein
LLEAKRFGTQHALMLVHSFDPADAGFRDFESFAHALGAASNDKAIWSVPHLDSPPLYVGWVRDQPPESAN